MPKFTPARFPASFFPSSMASNVATPPRPTASVASDPSTKSASVTRLVPPGLDPWMITSSALKSVGFTTTRIPFVSFQSVTFSTESVFSSTTRPVGGAVATSGASETVSVHAVTASPSTRRNVLSSSPAVGTPAVGPVGAETATTRLTSVIHCRPNAFTSSSVTVRRTRFAVSNSQAIPGVGSAVRK